MRLGPRFGSMGQPAVLARLGTVRHAAAPAPTGPVNIVDPAGWGNPSAGSVSADGAGNITFTAAGSGVNISEVPLVAIKPSTVYDWSANWTGATNKAVFGYGGVISNGGLLANGASSGQFTTNASVGDGKLYVFRSGIGSISGVVSGLSIMEH